MNVTVPATALQHGVEDVQYVPIPPLCDGAPERAIYSVDHGPRDEPPDMSTTNKAVITVLEDALNRQEFDVVAALHADEVRHQGVLATREDFMRFWTHIAQTFPDHHVTIDRLFAEDDWVVELMTMTGTHLGRAETAHHGHLKGVEPTGKTVSVKQSHYLTLPRDGLIAEHEVVRDDLGLHRQLGPAPPRPPGSR